MPKNRTITRVNEPKQSLFETDRWINRRRRSLVGSLERFVLESPSFRSRHLTLKFAGSGNSSLVCFIDGDADAYVLKLHLRGTCVAETHFLKAWKGVRVSVPEVVDHGNMGDTSYILMNRVCAPLLSTALRRGATMPRPYFEMGRTMRVMHSVQTNGYGAFVSGHGEYTTMKEWLYSDPIQMRIDAAFTNNLLGLSQDDLDQAFDELIHYSDRQKATSYCHYDFSPGNVLATQPLTVVDPFPLVNVGLLDLGRTVHLMAAKMVAPGGIDEFIRGYFGDESVDIRVIRAAVIVSAYTKCYYWLYRNKMSLIKNTMDFLHGLKNLRVPGSEVV